MPRGFEKVDQIAARKNLTGNAGQESGSESGEGGGESRLPVRLDLEGSSDSLAGWLERILPSR